MNKNPFHEIVKDAMGAQGLTMAQLGDKVGLNAGSISRFLAGKQATTSTVLQKMFEVLNINVQQIEPAGVLGAIDLIRQHARDPILRQLLVEILDSTK